MRNIFASRGIHADNVLSKAEFKPFGSPDFDIRKILAPYGASFICRAERLLETEYPMLNASMYMEYIRNGNRSHFEGRYFKRREMLCDFLFAELAEEKGRFTEQIIDGVWHIMEETSWIIPAHNWNGKNLKESVVSLPDTFNTWDENDDMKHIDLFSAVTGAFMAWVWYLSGDILDPQNPVIRTRLLSQLKQRILHPFYTYNHDWWMGEALPERLNNWTPWIISNVLTVIAFCEEDDALRCAGVEKCLVILDRYINNLPEDGGCDEGPGYWNVAGGSLFDCLELLYDMTDGNINIFDEDVVRRFCCYIMNVSIKGNTYINFADASSCLSPDFRMISRMGRRLGIPRLSAFASSLVYDETGKEKIDVSHFAIAHYSTYRSVQNMAEDIPTCEPFVPEKCIFFPNLQIAITRDSDDMFLALKGGHNNESHNHNDVGQFILFDGDTPIIMDAGVEAYTKTTFSPQRYTLWAMRGNYHNIPTIAGCEQQPGTQYRAETVSYDETTGALTLELKDAYPVEAGIVSYRRSALLLDSAATVIDDIHLTEAAPVEFHYLTADKPVFEGNSILFATGHKAEFDPVLLPSVEAIDLGNGKIAKEWKRDVLYRISLTTKEPITDAQYRITFTRV